MSRGSGPILAHVAAPHKATTSPIVTGTSVLAIKYKDGVMIASDTQGSYGSLARYTELRRIRRVGDYTMVAASGEYSDFQYIMDNLSELVMEEQLIDDDAKLTAPEIHSYLTRIMYQRRNKMDPFWNTIIVAGVKDGKSTLGYIDQLGTAFSDDYACTGFGMHLAMPLIRANWRADMTEEEARKLLEECMKILYYRDCRALNKIQIGTITADGAKISDPYVLSTKWDYKSFVQPKAGADTGGSW